MKAEIMKQFYPINGNSFDTRSENLIELTEEQYKSVSQQLQYLTSLLINKNFIQFNKSSLSYELSSQLYLSSLERSLGFEDIAIKQNKNICKSRLDTNISSEILRGIIRPIPLIASNMSTVVNAEFCILLYKLGALGIMHRADSNENILSAISTIAKSCALVAASIGIGEGQYEFATDMIFHGANIITIDIAHGYSDEVISLGKKIKTDYPHVKLILGNVTNPQIMYEADFADAIKVGIAQGFACETKNTAGCTEKQFSAIQKFKSLSKSLGLPIISDGGIREPADFTKAIAAGANSVMAGSIFAACPESAAEIKYECSGMKLIGTKKIYAGMASEYVQDKWKGGLKSGTCSEGGIRLLDLGPPVEKLLERYTGALRSGITYAGAYDINSFQQNADFVLIK